MATAEVTPATSKARLVQAVEKGFYDHMLRGPEEKSAMAREFMMEPQPDGTFPFWVKLVDEDAESRRPASKTPVTIEELERQLKELKAQSERREQEPVEANEDNTLRGQQTKRGKNVI